jgi:hypothetical protein
LVEEVGVGGGCVFEGEERGVELGIGGEHEADAVSAVGGGGVGGVLAPGVVVGLEVGDEI